MNLQGSQTFLINCHVVFMFKNYMNLQGSQTEELSCLCPEMFKNYMNLQGSQTKYEYPPEVASLRTI